MFKKTVKGELKFPPHVSEECADLVSKLLTADPAARYGMQRRGAQDIKEHPWYAGFDWRAFEAQTMAAPYVPVVRILALPACESVWRLPCLVVQWQWLSHGVLLAYIGNRTLCVGAGCAASGCTRVAAAGGLKVLQLATRPVPQRTARAPGWS